MMNCGKITSNLTLSQCGRFDVGVTPEIIIFNRGELFTSIVQDGVVQAIALRNVAYRYETYQNGVEVSSTMNEGTYAARFTHEVAFRVFVKTQKIKRQLNAMANGRFVAIVKNVSNESEEVKYEVYGFENGLVMTECEAVSNNAEGVVYSVVLTSGKDAEENELPLSYWAGSVEATESGIASLLGLYIDVTVQGAGASPVRFINQNSPLYKQVSAIAIDHTILPKEYYHTFNDGDWHTVRLFLSSAPSDFNAAFANSLINSISFHNIADTSVSRTQQMFYFCSRLEDVDFTNFDITLLGNFAFGGCTSLKSISIPDSVQSIGDYAFSGCALLKSITIPENVQSVGNYAFNGCSAALIILGKFVEQDYTNNTRPSNVGWLAGAQFKSVTIGNDITKIGAYAFRNCSTIEEVSMGRRIQTIGQSAFGGCSSLASIVIPDSVTTISNYVFIDCTSLTSITIPNSVQSVGAEAFRRCTSLTSISIPNSVQSVGGVAFDDCISLRNVEYNSPEVSYSCFSDCTSLTGVSLGNNVTHIEDWAFARCEALQSIRIPANVRALGAGAFHTCAALTEVYFEGKVPIAIDVDVFRGTNPNLTLKVPSQYLAEYQQAFPQFNIVPY